MESNEIEQRAYYIRKSIDHCVDFKEDNQKRRRDEVEAVKGEDGQDVVIRSRPDFAASLAHSRSKVA